MDESIQRCINWLANNWYCVFIVLYVSGELINTLIKKIRNKEKVKLDDIIACVNLAELSVPGKHYD